MSDRKAIEVFVKSDGSARVFYSLSEFHEVDSRAVTVAPVATVPLYQKAINWVKANPVKVTAVLAAVFGSAVPEGVKLALALIA